MSKKGILLKVKFFDNPEEKAFHGVKTLERSLKNFKVFLTKCQDKWEYATVYKNGSLYCYFHKNKGVEELDKKQYINELKESQINFYLVYKLEHKLRTNDHKGKALFNVNLDDIKSFFTNEIEKILVYQNNKIIATYQDGKYI